MLFQSNSSNSLSHNNTIVSSAVVKDIVQQSLVQLTLNFSSGKAKIISLLSSSYTYYQTVYIKNENGKILPSKDMVPFLNRYSINLIINHFFIIIILSLSECLSFVSKDEAIVFSSDSYPIASKLLLGNIIIILL